MVNKLAENICNICACLNRYNVQYLVIGGAAVAIYGFYRLSKSGSGELLEKDDIDIWYNPTYPNYFNLLFALKDFGVKEMSDFLEETTPQPKKSFFKFEFESFTPDFLPEIPGFKKFLPSFENRVESNIDGIVINIISRDDLLKNKKETSRPKDKEDIENLM